MVIWRLRNIALQLAEAGETVRALVLEGDPAAKHVPREAQIIYGDLSDMDSLEELFTVPEGSEVYVIHCASIVTLKPEPNPKVYAVNVNGTRNIIDMCLKHRVKKLVYISSTGAIPELPHGQKIKEVDHFVPTDGLVGYYSVTKAEASQLVLDAVRLCPELDASIVHPSGICGPNDYVFGPVAQVISQYVAGEMKIGLEGTFNSVDVRDLAAGVIACCHKGRRRACYIMSNELVTMRELYDIINRAANLDIHANVLSKGAAAAAVKLLKVQSMVTGKEPLLTDFGIYNLTRNNDFDCSKAQAELGFHCRPFEETIRDEVKWLQDAVRKEQTESEGCAGEISLSQRLERHQKMAESYRDSYNKHTVEGGDTYEDWVFAPHAQYWSPYFGDNVIDLEVYPMSVRQSATMEADTYRLFLLDWGPLDFRCWPSDRGFVMQTHFGGHNKSSRLWDFYAYGFVETNERCEITRWETHVSPEYNDFLDAVIGVHGPFKNGPEAYMEAVAQKLREMGIDPSKL